MRIDRRASGSSQPSWCRPFRISAAVLTLSLMAASSALANVHLMTIQEVFVGPPTDGDSRPVPLTPDQRAQYIVLRMTRSGQTVTNGSVLRVEDADGNFLGNFGQFTANVTSGGSAGCSYPSCPAIIMGTQPAKNLFTFTFDKIVN